MLKYSKEWSKVRQNLCEMLVTFWSFLNVAMRLSNKRGVMLHVRSDAQKFWLMLVYGWVLSI